MEIELNIDKNRCVGWWRTLVPTLDDLPNADLGNEWFPSTGLLARRLESKEDENDGPVSTRVKLLAIYEGTDVVNCYRVCRAIGIRATSEDIEREKHIPPFLGKVAPSPGTIRSTVTPCC